MIPYFSIGYHRPPFTPPRRRFGLTGSGRSGIWPAIRPADLRFYAKALSVVEVGGIFK